MPKADRRIPEQETGTHRRGMMGATRFEQGKTLQVSSPAPRDIWNEVLKSDETPFIYQTPLGMDAHCATFGVEDASRLYEFGNGRNLILPLFRRPGMPAALTIEETPHIGSLVSPGPPSRDEMSAIFSDLEHRPLFRTVIRPSALTGKYFEDAAPDTAFKIPVRSHVLDLQGGFDEVWKSRFNSQARRAVRKAEKSNLEILSDDTGKYIPEFYELLQRSIERWAANKHEPLMVARWRANRKDPIERFQTLAGTLGEAYRMWIAKVDGQAAAVIVVLFGKNAHYTRGAMDIDLAGPTRASFLLQKLAIQAACDAGCRYYNMGETGTSETLARFKTHFGAQHYDFFEYRFERLPLSRVEQALRASAKKLLHR